MDFRIHCPVFKVRMKGEMQGEVALYIFFVLTQFSPVVYFYTS